MDRVSFVGYTRLADLGLPGILLSSSQESQDDRRASASSFHMGAGDLNSGPHVHKTSTLLTEPSITSAKCTLKLGTLPQKAETPKKPLIESSPSCIPQGDSALASNTVSYWLKTVLNRNQGTVP